MIDYQSYWLFIFEIGLFLTVTISIIIGSVEKDRFNKIDIDHFHLRGKKISKKKFAPPPMVMYTPLCFGKEITLLNNQIKKYEKRKNY
jgi:hypothetical protein